MRTPGNRESRQAADGNPHSVWAPTEAGAFPHILSVNPGNFRARVFPGFFRGNRTSTFRSSRRPRVSRKLTEAYVCGRAPRPRQRGLHLIVTGRLEMDGQLPRACDSDVSIPVNRVPPADSFASSTNDPQTECYSWPTQGHRQCSFSLSWEGLWTGWLVLVGGRGSLASLYATVTGGGAGLRTASRSGLHLDLRILGAGISSSISDAPIPSVAVS